MTLLGSGWDLGQDQGRLYHHPVEKDTREDGHEGPGAPLSDSVTGAFRLGRNTVLASPEPGEAFPLSQKGLQALEDVVRKGVPAPHLHPPTHLHLDPQPSHTQVLTALGRLRSPALRANMRN